MPTASYLHISIFPQKNGLSTELAVELFFKVQTPGPDLILPALGIGACICIILPVTLMHTQGQVCSGGSLCLLGWLLGQAPLENFTRAQ